LKFS